MPKMTREIRYMISQWLGLQRDRYAAIQRARLQRINRMNNITDNPNDWNVTSPGILALSHTLYEIRHERINGSWYFNIYWRGECVRPCSTSLSSAKQTTLDHLNEMLQMGYEA